MKKVSKEKGQNFIAMVVREQMVVRNHLASADSWANQQVEDLSQAALARPPNKYLELGTISVPWWTWSAQVDPGRYSQQIIGLQWGVCQ